MYCYLINSTVLTNEYLNDYKKNCIYEMMNKTRNKIDWYTQGNKSSNILGCGVLRNKK